MAGKSIHVIRAQAGLDIQPLVQGLNQASQRVKQFATESKQAMETSGASTLDTLRMLGYSGGKNAKSIPGGPSERAVQLKKQQEEEKKLWLIQQARARDERRNADMAKLNADIADRQRNAARESMALDRQAAAVKAMLTTEEERHNARVKQYDNLLKNNRLTVQQHAAAVKMSANALAMQQGGFGRMSGAMAQASFAIEDFAQVLSMGGGLNMALMSASNNVAMVVRSLLATNAAMSAIAGLAIPFVMIGISQLFRSFQSQANAAEEWVKSLSNYFDVLNFSLDQAQTKLERQRELEDIRQAKGGGTSASNIDEINKSLLEQQRIQEDLGLMESKRDSIIRQIASGSDELAKGINDRAENMLMLADNIGGIVETMLGPSPSERPEAIRALRDEHLEIARIADETFRQNLKNASSLEEFITANQIYLSQIAEIPGIAAKNERERITAMLDSEEKTKEHFTSLEELQHKLNVEEEKQLKLRTELIKSLEREEQQRKDILFAMTASPEAKLQADLEKQRQEFVGITPSDIMADPRLEQDYLQRSTEFLLAAQEQTQRQIDELQKVAMPAFTGELQQDAFRAQAEAFKQMDQARQEKRNPQLDQQIDLLRRINDALQSGGTITLVGGP